MPTTAIPISIIAKVYLVLVAICHQTSPKGRPPLEGTVAGKRKRGWDYLSAKFEDAARADRSLLALGLSVERVLGLLPRPKV